MMVVEATRRTAVVEQTSLMGGARGVSLRSGL